MRILSQHLRSPTLRFVHAHFVIWQAEGEDFLRSTEISLCCLLWSQFLWYTATCWLGGSCTAAGSGVYFKCYTFSSLGCGTMSGILSQDWLLHLSIFLFRFCFNVSHCQVVICKNFWHQVNTDIWKTQAVFLSVFFFLHCNGSKPWVQNNNVKQFYIYPQLNLHFVYM